MRCTCSGVRFPIDFGLDVCKLLVVAYKMKLGPAQSLSACRELALSPSESYSGGSSSGLSSVVVELPRENRRLLSCSLRQDRDARQSSWTSVAWVRWISKL